MNIKSLLIGSAAALAAVSGAQAADAIVAAEPEAVEYVRVCDAFGAGYFYIPGTETCLKISGYVRVQVDVKRGASQYSDYDVFARGRLAFEAKNDTELGTLTSVVRILGKASEVTSTSGNTTTYDNGAFELDLAYIELAGFRAGLFLNWWDDGLVGETDSLSNKTNLAALRYVYSGESFSAGLAVEELTYSPSASLAPHTSGTYKDANLGIDGMLAAKFSGVTATLLGGYDIDLEEFAIRGIVSAGVGPGKLEIGAIYSSGPSAYYHLAEWTVAAAYGFKATDKLTITPAAQYFGDYGYVNGNDAWKVGLTAEYKVTSGLTALATVNYLDADNAKSDTSGFLRLERSF